MKTTFLILLFSGMLFIGQKTKSPIVVNDDKGFEQLMKDFHQTMAKNKVVQQKADSTKDVIIVETSKKITELAKENKELKIELNEVKDKLDNLNDTGRSFELLPISDH